jgi:DNA-binding NarL/FixJ family response regulator
MNNHQRKLKIILADDNHEVLKSLELLFNIEGEISIAGQANNCEDAISLVKQLKPDLLIIDLEMAWVKSEKAVKPEINFAGAEAIHTIRRLDQKIPIYVLTVHDYSEARQAALMAGANRVFIKGRDTHLLIQAVNNLKLEK